jgi:predicted phage terminase large subunit-like protein
MLARHLAILNRKLVDLAAGRITRLLVNMPPRSGKALDHKTPVPTTKGWKIHKDLHEGDYVYGQCSTPKKVISESQEYDINCEIIFNHDEKIICHENHEWPIYDREENSWKVLETKDLIPGNRFLIGSATLLRTIKQINRIQPVKGKCIQVEDGLYQIGHRRIITHNSELISKYYPAWYLGTFPKNKVMLTSYEASFAAEWGAMSRDILEEYGEEVFGIKISSSSSAASKWKIEDAGGGMYAVGAGGAITGKGANLLIIDDPIKNPLFLDTDLPTPEGWQKIKDIKIGDFVFDHAGKPTKVTGVSDVIKRKKCVVTFMDGEQVICDLNHSWTCFTRNEHSCYTNKHKTYDENWWKWANKGYSRARTFTTEEMLEIGLRNHKGQTNFTIPTTLPLELPKKEYDIDPYLFGLWLGDGTSGEPRITAHKDDAVFYMEYISNLDIWAREGLTSPKAREASPDTRIISMSLNKGGDCRWSDSLRKHFLLTKTDEEKDVPQEYLRGSIEQRVELIKGLMDTDGTVCSGQVVFCNKNKKLIYAIYELFVSVGSNATIHEKENEYGIYWTVSACPMFCPFKLPRKVTSWQEDTGKPSIRRLNRTIDTIELFDDEVEYKCINVEAESHLFLCGKGMIPTHNSEEAESAVLKDKLWNWFGCFHPDHDYLTDKGWVNVKDVKKDTLLATVNPETLEISYKYPTALHKYEYDGYLYEYPGQANLPSFCVTPNHKMWSLPYNKPTLVKSYCEDLPEKCKIPQRFVWKGSKISRTFQVGKKKYWTKGLFSFIGYILYRSYKFLDNGQMCFISNNLHLPEILKKWKIPYRREGKAKYIFGKHLSRYIRSLKGRIPKELRDLAPKYLDNFLEFYRYKSSRYNYNDPIVFFTINNRFNRICDDLVEIMIKCGYKVSYTTKNTYIRFSKHPEKYITPWGNYLRHRPGDKNNCNVMHKVPYKGYVYCVTVPPYHTVITRYKGSITLSGQSTAYTRLQPGNSSICLIQTRWSSDDLAGRILESMEKGGEQWEVLNFPAIAEEDESFRKKGEALWPEMWPLDKLMAIKNSGAMSSYIWAALYQQRPVPEGGGLFKKDWFRYFVEEPSLYNLGGRYEEKDKCWRFVTVDMAYKEKKTSDYTVIALWAVTKKNDLLLLKMYRERYNYDEVLKKIIDVFKEDKPLYVGVENMGTGIALIREARNKGLPMRELEPHGKGKQNRATMPLGAVVRMESGKIFFRKGEKWLHDLETELLYFPKGKNDDCVDVLSYACNELSKIDTFEDGDFLPYDLENIIGLKKAGNVRILY